MARFDIGSFAGNFMQAFQQAQGLKAQQKLQKDELKHKTALYELQLKREQMGLTREEDQDKARRQLFDMVSGTALAPNPVPPMLRPPGAPETVPGKALSLTDLLADPQNAALLLRSGMIKPDDILAQEGARANRAMVERVMGGGGTAGMELTGVKIGPNGQLMPDFGQPQVTSPQAIDTPGGPRLQTFNPRTGAMVADLGAPKEEKRTPEEAGRISGLLQAQQIGTGVREKIVKPDGSINRALVMTAFGKVPGSEGRTLRNDMGIAVDAVLRARTGAGVNAEELRQVVDQFMPSPLDSDDGIKSKMDRFDQFVNGALDVATLPPRVRKALEGQQRQQGPQGGAKVIDFSELPD